MEFAQRHNQIKAKAGPLSPKQLWINTAVFALFVFMLVSVYHFFESGTYDLFVINTLLAVTGMLLIGLSFMLSGLTYFWDFVDTKLIYRKYLGLTGFYIIVVHAAFSLEQYLFIYNAPKPNFELGFLWAIGPFLISNVFAFASGLIALAIFTMMALISTRYALMELGGIRWRQLLRLGYAAYLIIVVHFGLKRFETWSAWLQGKNGLLPPISLLLLIFVGVVLVLRLALLLSLEKVKKAKPRQQSIEENTTAPALTETKKHEETEG